MGKTSFEVFQSIVCCVARADLANRNGEEEEAVGFLGDARSLIEANGLNGFVGIHTIPFNSGEVLRLRGPDGHGISYTIGQDGITFP